ncbi:hypothetical protein L484_021315 [Morus notabilis]|uniref:Uncharacterized protein n=1 Tax=Morus notabilis TaxID=981085 RepID=W9SG68_9ROSA|nr:hypothetical protein L484_021315 [Morus notabilis]
MLQRGRVEAISAQDNTTARELLSQEKCISKEGAKLLKSVKENLGPKRHYAQSLEIVSKDEHFIRRRGYSQVPTSNRAGKWVRYRENLPNRDSPDPILTPTMQGGMAWERPQVKLNWKELGEKQQVTEMPMKGMEIALSFSSTYPISIIDEKFKQVLEISKVQIGLKLEHAKCFVPLDTTTAPEGKRETSEENLWTPQTSSIVPENLPGLFLLYCMEFLQDDPPIISNFDKSPKLNSKGSKEKLNSFERAFSLDLAVLFGLIYNKENGHRTDRQLQSVLCRDGRPPSQLQMLGHKEHQWGPRSMEFCVSSFSKGFHI